MGTTYHISLANPALKLDLGHLQNIVDDELVMINQLMSTYIPDSELSRFNQAPINEWFQLSKETFTVLKYSLSVAEKTQGQFDITVGPLTNLWGFGPLERAEFPSDKKIKEVMGLIGWESIVLDETNFQVKKTQPVLIDLSAVAKGYGVDHIANTLDQYDIANYLVEIGGEIRAKGVNSSGKPWRIGIETPTLHQTGAQKIIQLKNKAIATSGDYRNFFEKEGVRYSHTIDPNTGKPVVHNIASLTVITEKAMNADALATALMVLGEKKALEMANRHNIAVYILLYEDNTFSSQHSSAFTDYLH